MGTIEELSEMRMRTNGISWWVQFILHDHSGPPHVVWAGPYVDFNRALAESFHWRVATLARDIPPLGI